MRQGPNKEHSYWSSQWNNKKRTSLRHKVRLQPQTRTMENTCSVLLSGKEYQTHQNVIHMENQHVLQHQNTQTDIYSFLGYFNNPVPAIRLFKHFLYRSLPLLNMPIMSFHQHQYLATQQSTNKTTLKPNLNRIDLNCYQALIDRE